MRCRCRKIRITRGSHIFTSGTHLVFTKRPSRMVWRSGTSSQTSHGECANLLSSLQTVTGLCLGKNCRFSRIQKPEVHRPNHALSLGLGHDLRARVSFPPVSTVVQTARASPATRTGATAFPAPFP